MDMAMFSKKYSKIKTQETGCRDGLILKSVCCSSAGPKFSS